MLPDRCTSIHSQEEPTENRVKTNESNIKSKIINLYIYTVYKYTN